MDTQEKELLSLLREHDFALVRQRKHKIYRNPEGIIFVASSTPSDRMTSQNALSTLRRILRKSSLTFKPAVEPATALSLTPEVGETGQVSPKPEPATNIESLSTPLSEREWEDWKRDYWRDEKARKRNERFLSDVGKSVGRVSEVMHGKRGVAWNTAADAIRVFLRDLGYKCKVVLYTFRAFEQGIVVFEAPDQPIVWASNGHIGISAFVYLDTYVQHGPERPDLLRFVDWDGNPVLFERPEKGLRKYFNG